MITSAALAFSTAIAGVFNVQFTPGLDAASRASHLSNLPSSIAVQSTFVIGDQFAGYTATAKDDVTRTLRRQPHVLRVEADIPMRKKGATPPTCYTQQPVPSWGLARVSEVKCTASPTAYKFAESQSRCGVLCAYSCWAFAHTAPFLSPSLSTRRRERRDDFRSRYWCPHDAQAVRGTR